MTPSLSLLLLKIFFVVAALAFAVYELWVLRRLKREREAKKDVTQAEGGS